MFDQTKHLNNFKFEKESDSINANLPIFFINYCSLPGQLKHNTLALIGRFMHCKNILTLILENYHVYYVSVTSFVIGRFMHCKNILTLILENYHVYYVSVTSFMRSLKNGPILRWPKWLTFHFYTTSQFRILNSEICTANFGIRNCEVYVVWASGNS